MDKSESCIESCHRQKGYVSFICLHLRIIITFILVTATATKRNMSKLQPIATSEAGSSSSTVMVPGFHCENTVTTGTGIQVAHGVDHALRKCGLLLKSSCIES